ncbi:MAG: hypothetical protein QNK03_20955 [Myxococcota bacterium]|nr:hypothetical protein [Myxococcota bacterium]
MIIVAHFGEVQTLVLLGLVYGFVIGPAATVIAIGRGDFLTKRGLGEPGSAWRDADSRPPELDNVKQPF